MTLTLLARHPQRLLEHIDDQGLVLDELLSVGSHDFGHHLEIPKHLFVQTLILHRGIRDQ